MALFLAAWIGPGWADTPSASLPVAAISTEAASAPIPTGRPVWPEAIPEIASKASVQAATENHDSNDGQADREKLERLTSQLAEIEKIGVWISYSILVLTAAIPLLAAVVAILPYLAQRRIHQENKERWEKTENEIDKRFTEHNRRMSDDHRKLEDEAYRKINSVATEMIKVAFEHFEKETATRLTERLAEQDKKLRSVSLDVVRKEIPAAIDREYGSLIRNYLDHRLEEMSLNGVGGRAAIAGLATEYLHLIIEAESQRPNEAPLAASLLDRMLTIWQTLGQIYSLNRSAHEQAFMKLTDSHPTRHALPRLRRLLADYRNAGGAQDERLAQLAEDAINACEGDAGPMSTIRSQ
jgi:CHASE3 domain sensor protein